MRGTLPRFRYDQLMNFGWRFLMPLAILNIVANKPLACLPLIYNREKFPERAMHLILFFVFAGLCLAGAINLLLQSHPINSALSLIVVMTSLAVLYLLLGAEFLAAAQVIVYAGAIMVLFTFVVMLLNAGREERTLGSRAARAVGFPAVVAILAVIATVILHAQGLGVAELSEGITSTEELSRCSSPNCCCPLRSPRC